MHTTISPLYRLPTFEWRGWHEDPESSATENKCGRHDPAVMCLGLRVCRKGGSLLIWSYQTIDRKISLGSRGPASVEFSGTPQARSTSSCGGSLCLETLEMAILSDIGEETKCPWLTIGLPFRAKRRIGKSIISLKRCCSVVKLVKISAETVIVVEGDN